MKNKILNLPARQCRALAGGKFENSNFTKERFFNNHKTNKIPIKISVR
ncbi:MAG: hypothetical protein HYV39_02175 [Candidatus Levybacteria bacterium]|nr:hypothetical protein [Candidatus Levybacteria bacterium]